MYEIKFRDFQDMCPYVILHPGRAFIDTVPDKNLVGRLELGKPIGPFKLPWLPGIMLIMGWDSASNLWKTWKFLCQRNIRMEHIWHGGTDLFISS